MVYNDNDIGDDNNIYIFPSFFKHDTDDDNNEMTMKKIIII